MRTVDPELLEFSSRSGGISKGGCRTAIIMEPIQLTCVMDAPRSGQSQPGKPASKFASQYFVIITPRRRIGAH
jgi:hypothetical protein